MIKNRRVLSILAVIIGVLFMGAQSLINLTNQVTGTLPHGNGGTDNTSYTNGQVLIGNTGSGGLDKNTLTQGSGITITNAAGSITIAATGFSGSYSDNEVVTCSGTSCTLAHTPTGSSQHFYKNGQRLTPGIGLDYTISGTTITLAVAALAGDTFLADYRY